MARLGRVLLCAVAAAAAIAPTTAAATAAVTAAAAAAAAATPPAAAAAAPLTLRARQLAALQYHIDRPWPSTKAGQPGGVSTWGEVNLALARLAHDRLGAGGSPGGGRAPNATLAAEISAQVAGWETDPRFTPWANYPVNGPLGGLGALPVLCRLALLPLTRAALSVPALSALERIAFNWLSPRSNASWAGQANSWLLQDGSENLDATHKANLYLCAVIANRSDARHAALGPDTLVALDGRPVRAHAAAWEGHWGRYFAHRAVEGIGAELGSPTYAKYSLQAFANVRDLSGSAALAARAGDFLTLWFVRPLASILLVVFSSCCFIVCFY